jgi:hypothetical protein
MKSTKLFRTLILGLFFTFFLSGCNESADTSSSITIVIPTLTNGSIKAFIHSLSKDYSATSSNLVTAYNSYKNSGDSFGFTQFRNQKWTPAYMEKKRYYQAVYKQNKTYITSNNLTPLFLAYENLIYIGINLKNSLLDNNSALEKEALTSLKKDQATILKILN